LFFLVFCFFCFCFFFSSIWEKNVRLATKAETPETLPEEPSDEIEVALVGRSNVGKSSLLNALANSYGERTARTSDRPGETQAVTFYRVGKTFRLVDLPGYGFAFADEAKSNEMSAVMRAYLQQRKALKHVVLLIDARHGFKATDTEMAQWLHKNCAAKLHVCLTKCDTIEPDQLKRIASMTKDDAAKFTKEPLLLVSALKKQGIDVLRREIARFRRAVGLPQAHSALPAPRRTPRSATTVRRRRRRRRSGGRRRARRTAHSQEGGEARPLSACRSRRRQ
jgi:ribosome biogenesis GTP-binding protein YsxC/EngB